MIAKSSPSKKIETKESIETKDFVILGAGISGLSAGLYLKQRVPKQSILLLEKEDRPGGWIRTLQEKEFFFDTGPKGFLAGGKGMKTLEMVYDLGIDQKLVESNDSSRVRFLYYQNKLHALPRNIREVFRSELLGGRELKTVFKGLLKKDRSQKNKEESVSEFIQRRFSQNILDRFIDPWITGVYAGNANQLSAISIFPRLKRQNASILGSILKSSFQKTVQTPKEKRNISRFKLLSFQGGMETLVQSLYRELKTEIRFHTQVQNIEFLPHETILCYTNKKKETKRCKAKILIFATPSYTTANYLKDLNFELSELLSSIEYADLKVLHLGYKKTTRLSIPRGFGFLVPRSEGLDLLGVIFNEEVFPSIFNSEGKTLTAMYGGACNPELMHWPENRLFELAQKELFQTLGISEKADCRVLYSCKKAIPQYNLGHSQKIQKIQTKLKHYPLVHITGNYFNGVGINDCIDHAYHVVESLISQMESKQVKSRQLKSLSNQNKRINPIRKKS